MGQRGLVFMGAIIIIALLLGGCAKPPTEEMEKADAAVTQAENDPDAVLYGEESLIRAKNALTQMRVSADSKRYDEAKLLAQEAIDAAEKARNDGSQGAIRAKEEAERLLLEAQNALDATEKTVNMAKTLDKVDADFDTLTLKLENARNTIGEAETALNASRYQDSQNKSREARTSLGDITSEISGAVSKKSRKK
jgi:PBP1b-binding outer membrane lipoprotein LpoB